MKYGRLFMGVLVLGATLWATSPVLAQINANTTGLTATGSIAYGTDNPLPLPVLIGKIISVFIGLAGLLMFVLLVYAGAMWMTAQGDSDKVKKAQNIITASVIGLLIVLSAYAITTFVTTQLMNSVNNTPAVVEGSGGEGGDILIE